MARAVVIVVGVVVIVSGVVVIVVGVVVGVVGVVVIVVVVVSFNVDDRPTSPLTRDLLLSERNLHHLSKH